MPSSKLTTPKQESKMNFYSSCALHKREVKAIEIDGEERIRSVACLVDGEHVVSGGAEGKLRLWRMQDGKEAATLVGVGSVVCNIVVSRDGNWVLAGTNDGEVVVWKGETRKATVFVAHDDWVRAVDVSPDGMRIATGSYDRSVCIWSFSSPPDATLSSRPLLGPLRHEWSLAAVKFSPDGRLLATATWCRSSIRIYDSQDGRLLVEFSVQVSSSENQSIAWASDSKQLFALSRDGVINRLDVCNGTTLSQWPIHSPIDPRCIVLACDERIIAASAGSSVSFWDTTSHKLVGSVIGHSALIASMAITRYDLVIGGGKKITLRSLYDVLPSSYCEDRPCTAQKLKVLVKGLANHVTYRTTAQVKISNLEKAFQALCRQDGHPNM